MLHTVVCVSDRALGAFMRPFFAPNLAMARRSFSDEVNRAGSEMGAHPEDYELHSLGSWNDQTGDFQFQMSVVCRALDVFKGA